MKRIHNLIFGLFAIASLSACVSDQEDSDRLSLADPNAQAPTQQLHNGYSRTEQDTIEALFRSQSAIQNLGDPVLESLKSNAAGITWNMRQDTSSQLSVGEVELRRGLALNSGASKELVLTAFGRKTSFLVPLFSTDKEVRVTLPDGQTTVYLWAPDGSWNDVLNGRGSFKYLVRFGTSDYNSATQINRRAYGVFGLATPDDLLPTTGTATYSGVFSGTGHRNGTSNQVSVIGDIELLADFAQENVSGKLDGLMFGGTAMPDVFEMQAAKISPDGFTAGLKAGSSSCSDCLVASRASNVTGDFYGNAAQEVGGTFVIDGVSSSSNTQVFMSGSFGASKQ